MGYPGNLSTSNSSFRSEVPAKPLAGVASQRVNSESAKGTQPCRPCSKFYPAPVAFYIPFSQIFSFPTPGSSPFPLDSISAIPKFPIAIPLANLATLL